MDNLLPVFCLPISEDGLMNFQNAELPAGAELAGSTPVMTEETIVPGILANHMAPKGKCGLLVVEEGVTQKQDIEHAVELLKTTNIVGTVLNKAETKS